MDGIEYSNVTPHTCITRRTNIDRCLCLHLVTRYELQYAVAGRGVANDDTAAWQAVEGNAKDTWDITVRVDGFDRYDMRSLISGHTSRKKRI